MTDYGLNDDGTYNTPYLTTVVYDPTSVFETSLAKLVDSAQLIPLSLGSYRFITSKCKHPSPELLFFRPTAVADRLPELREYGFQNIRALCDGDIEGAITFTLDTIYDNVKFGSSLTTTYLIELIIKYHYPQYESFVQDMTFEKSELFYLGISPDVDLSALCLDTKGMEIIDSAILMGKMMLDTVQRETESKYIYELNNNIIHAYPSNAIIDKVLTRVVSVCDAQDADYILTYKLSPERKWIMKVFAVGDNNAVDFCNRTLYSDQFSEDMAHNKSTEDQLYGNIHAATAILGDDVSKLMPVLGTKK